MRKIEIVVAQSAAQAEALRRQGYCPVECSFGEVSVVDELILDHHGELSALSPVCIRSFERHSGKRADDPRFVVCGGPDADAVLSIIALTDAVNVLTFKESGSVHEDFHELYELAALRDRDPHVDMVEQCKKNSVNTILLWFLQQRFRDWSVAVAGVVDACDQWISDPDCFQYCLEKEQSRKEQSSVDMEAGTVFPVNGTELSILLVEPDGGFGFDVFYQKHDFVVLFVSEHGTVTVGARDAETAKKLGSRGLLDVFEELSKEQPGWGGSETVGGSPRGQKMEMMDAVKACFVLACNLASSETFAMWEPYINHA